jgi:dipeptidyl aminopeptidase/acylaminoacyl peptidase
MFAILAMLEPKFPLTVASIMRGVALIGRSPSNLQWSADGSELYFSWGKADGTQNPRTSEFRVGKDGAGLAEAGERKPIDRLPRNYDRFGNLDVYSRGGSLYVLDEGTSLEKRIASTPQPKNSPLFLQGGKSIAFKMDDNYYRFNLATGETVQLTNFQPIRPESPVAALPPSQKVLSSEESSLFKYFGGGRGGGFRRFSRRSRGGPVGSVEAGTSIEIPAGFSLLDTDLSSSGKSVVARFFAPPVGDRPTEVPNYITRSGYTETIPSYEKVGDKKGKEKLEVVDLDSGDSIELKLPREGSAQEVRWSPDGSKFVCWASSDDHKDRWLESYDTATGSFSQIFDEHSAEWVGGPGSGTLGWLPDGKRVYFQSEKTGFSQLYTIAPDGSGLNAVTSGPFEVFSTTLDAKNQRFVFESSEGSPFQRHVDSVSFDGGNRTRLAELSADEESTFQVAPDGKTVAVVRSTSNRPPELFIGSKQITVTPTPEWLQGPWTIPPIVMIKARDGVSVPAHIYKPKSWKRGGPAVIFVHGAGYLQNVYEGWSYYYREYMFHHLLTSLGYIVLDMDYRGSAGYGADWRTAIYRHMGGKDLDDNVDGARWLVANQHVAADRIGIYGGSYGGFLTLMAMFIQPGVFAAGAALRPVSDWANYNDGYTSEILNDPQDDPVAYRQSSPINFVGGLRGSLLICHGVVDTNVHFQDSVRLTEKLIELGKEDWEIAPYPVEDHSFVHPESWTDEYRRILKLFETKIGNHRAAR